MDDLFGEVFVIDEFWGIVGFVVVVVGVYQQELCGYVQWFGFVVVLYVEVLVCIGGILVGFEYLVVVVDFLVDVVFLCGFFDVVVD